MKKKNNSTNVIKLILFLIILLSLFQSCESGINKISDQEYIEGIAKQLVPSIPKNSTILIIPPEVSNPSFRRQYGFEEEITYVFSQDYGEFMNGLLISELAKLSGTDFSILDRASIEYALQELKFQISDLVDRKKARKLGNFLGANYFITGSIYARNIKNLEGVLIFYDEYQIYKVTETESLKIVGSANSTR